jgi:hypothetical protein
VILVRFGGFQDTGVPRGELQGRHQEREKKAVKSLEKNSKQESQKKSLTFVEKITPTRPQSVKKIRGQIQNE